MSRPVPSPRRTGSSGASRLSWDETYATTDYRDLPWFSPRPSAWLVEAVKSRWVRPPARLLDLGCGAGTNALWMARQGFNVTGLDLAPTAIDRARERARRAKVDVDFGEGDVLDLPFGPASFDVATDIGCFHALPLARRRDYAAEVARVLRPEGVFLLRWIGREHTAQVGPPHRPSVLEAAQAFEAEFVLQRVSFMDSGSAGYGAALVRRSSPQPPPR